MLVEYLKSKGGGGLREFHVCWRSKIKCRFSHPVRSTEEEMLNAVTYICKTEGDETRQHETRRDKTKTKTETETTAKTTIKIKIKTETERKRKSKAKTKTKAQTQIQTQT